MMKNLNSCILKLAFPNILLLFLIGPLTAQDELNVITNKWQEYTDAPNSLYRHLSARAYELLSQRSGLVSRLQTLDQWQERQTDLKQIFNEIVGPFPEKTPLNAKTTKIIKKEGFRVEHIIYESQPGFFVTSSLYIPDGVKKSKKAPAVIYCSGHSEDGYRSSVYQHVILNLVKKGFVVFAFDPVGQGERLEYPDGATGKSILGGPTMEHSYPGAQAFITGSSQAKYMIWDGIRAVDFLLTRKEVDPSRIGITGRSGGGTQSAHIAALDDRILAAAPENYITNYTRLIQSIGPQDAEQNMFDMIGSGLDHADFLIVRAPKPALMITTTDDMFNIQGAMETEKEVARIYKLYGKEENFSRVEDNAPHASTLKNREAMYAFFQKHLKNPGNPKDEETIVLTKEEMMVTPTGQLSNSLKGETVFSLNKREAEKTNDILISLRNNDNFLTQAVNSAKKLSGYIEPSSSDEPVFTGRIVRDSYVIDRYFIKGEGDYLIPYLLFRPDSSGKNALIYLHPSGKSVEATKGGDIEKFVNEGITVLAPDLVGTGETGPGTYQGDAYFDGTSHNLWYSAMLTGRSIVGIRAGDVIKLAKILKKDYPNIAGLARKEMSPVLLHAAAFYPEIGKIILIEPYSSYYSVVSNHFYDPHYILGTVPHSLAKYDLPDLAASLAPRKLLIAGTTDGSGKVFDIQLINDDLGIISSSYAKKNAASDLTILPSANDSGVYSLIFKLLR